MCYLIQFGVPARHAHAVPKGRLPRVDRQHNPSVSAAFGSSFATFCVTDGGCSCHLYSAPDREGSERDRTRTGMLRRKYERLGWSKAEIARALAASVEGRAQSNHDSPPGIRPDVAELLADLVDVAGEIRLIVHQYHGSFAEEPIPTPAACSMSAREFREAGHAAILQDTVYVIRH
ncbi:MAG TPA: hypothetical protein VGF28_15585 [Thermoanaerobaculia bacterium]